MADLRSIENRINALSAMMPAPPAEPDGPIDDEIAVRLRRLEDARQESLAHPTAIDVKAELMAEGEGGSR